MHCAWHSFTIMTHADALLASQSMLATLFRECERLALP